VNELGGLGLPDLDAGIQLRDSPLGRALRTLARANRAVDSGRRQDAEAARADADAARGMLPENPLVLYVSLYARLSRRRHLPGSRASPRAHGRVARSGARRSGSRAIY